MESKTKNAKIYVGIFRKHKHTLIMAIGCMIPLLLIGIMWIAGVSQNILSFGILLLCPLMHLVMMKKMKHGKQNPENRVYENRIEGFT